MKTVILVGLFALCVSGCGGGGESEADGTVNAIQACNRALLPDLESTNETDLQVARIMFGSDAGTEVTRRSDGSYTVNVSRGVQAGRPCLANLVGSCTVESGVARVTKSLVQEGYVPC